MSRSYGFLRSAARQLRLDSAKELKSLKGKKPTGAYVYVATTYPDWRKAVLKTARAVCNGSLVEKKELLGAQEGPGLRQGRALREAGEARDAVRELPARLRRGGRVRCF